MNNSIYCKMIQKSPLIFKIKEAAPKIFDLWRDHTKPRYPDYSFKADTKTLITDLTMAFAKSLKWLCKEEKKDKREIQGWSEGFVLGCVSSTLSTRWSYQYVYVVTNEYKQLLLLKTLIQYLDFDSVTLEKLEKLYNYFIGQKVDIIDKINNENEKVGIIDKVNNENEAVIYIDKFIKEKQNAGHNKFKKELIKYLENIMLEKHLVIFNQILEEQYLPEINNFISYDEVQLLINEI